MSTGYFSRDESSKGLYVCPPTLGLKATKNQGDQFVGGRNPIGLIPGLRAMLIQPPKLGSHVSVYLWSFDDYDLIDKAVSVANVER